MMPGRMLGLLSIVSTLLAWCGCQSPDEPEDLTVPHETSWGIYSLELATEQVALIYSSPTALSGLQLSSDGECFAFTQRMGGEADSCEEICRVKTDGTGFRQLTNNQVMDTYPCWSPDGSRILYLSWGSETMDILIMGADGSDARLFYDSGYHDADINWVGERIVFTRQSRIWTMDDTGLNDHQLTTPPRAGEWGNANLPYGDYDPRISPDGSLVVFSRLVNDSSPHGNYDLYLIGVDGSGERAVTTTGFTQGLSQWSHGGDEIVFVVAAIDDVGRYDLYTVSADGTDYRSITPSYFPAAFLCHSAVFAPDDRSVYFIGQWYE